MNILTLVSNPWKNITKCGYYVANCDKAEILDCNNRIKGIKEKFQLQLLPEPFLGNPNAQVYLLNGNPGYSKDDEHFINDSLFQELARNSMLHRFVPEYNDFLYFNDIQFKNKKHPGCIWWAKNTKQLQKAISRTPRFFNIEFCAYHSINAKHIPEYLPSYSYSDQLIRKAIEENKIIIAMRMANRWIKRIPQLKNYPNLYRLLNPQNVCLTSGNVVLATNAFGTLINNC